MSGLIERLLESAQDLRHQAHSALREPDEFALILDAEMAEEAAARITALEVENERLKAALASLANTINIAGGPYDLAIQNLDLIVSNVKKQARQALVGGNK